MSQNIEGEALLGMNASQIDGDQISGYNKPGFYLGGAAGFELKKDFGVKFRIMFSQKGSRASEDDPFFLVYRLNYLEFPLIFDYTYKQKFLFEAGLQPYILVSARVDDGFGFTSVSDQFEPLTYGFYLGGGYVLDKWTLRIVFQRSLDFLTKNGGFFDRTLTFCVGYTLN